MKILLGQDYDEGIFIAIPECGPDSALVMPMINTDPIPIITVEDTETVTSAIDIINLTSYVRLHTYV
eukprot:scaffold26238_cov70-Cyclotella_meneghiniana.AAC.2